MDQLDNRTLSSTDRGLACATHILSIFFPITAAAIAYVIFNKSRPYVAAHAIGALMDEIVLKIIFFIAGAVSLGFTITKIVTMVQNGENLFTWDMLWQTMLKMAISWVIVAIVGVIVTILTLMQAYRSYRGNWPQKGLAGKYARKHWESSAALPS